MRPSASLLAVVAQQAQVLAYADSSKVVALATLINLPLVALLRKPTPTATPAARAQPTSRTVSARS